MADKKRWVYQIDIFPHQHEGCETRPATGYTIKPQRKARKESAIGRALLLIHNEMLGEMYDLTMRIGKDKTITLVADGHRGGYPEQPASMTVMIRPYREGEFSVK